MEKMDKKDEIMLVNGESLVKKIYIIRGQKVMLDSFLNFSNIGIVKLLTKIKIRRRGN